MKEQRVSNLLILAVGKDASFAGFKDDFCTLLFNKDINGIGG